MNTICLRKVWIGNSGERKRKLTGEGIEKKERKKKVF